MCIRFCSNNDARKASQSSRRCRQTSRNASSTPCSIGFQTTNINVTVGVLEHLDHGVASFANQILHVPLGLTGGAREYQIYMDEVFGQLGQRPEIRQLLRRSGADPVPVQIIRRPERFSASSCARSQLRHETSGAPRLRGLAKKRTRTLARAVPTRNDPAIDRVSPWSYLSQSETRYETSRPASPVTARSIKSSAPLGWKACPSNI